jgi:hypothetical protein
MLLPPCARQNRRDGEPGREPFVPSREARTSAFIFPETIIMARDTQPDQASGAVEAVVAEQRRIQAEVDRIDEDRPDQPSKGPMQAGQRKYP